MPRDLPTGLVSLLKSGFAETHSTLAITLLGAGRSIKQTIYVATAAEGGASGPAVGQNPPAALTIANAGFETPLTGDYLFNPAGAGWTFASTSGVAHTGGNILAGAAPEGLQVAFLQIDGAISQALTGFVSGVDYQVKFKMAQRLVAGFGNQDFDVFLDAILLGHVAPASAAFEQVTLPFTAGASSYTFKIQGKNTAGGNQMGLIDDVHIEPATGGTSKPPGRGGGVQYAPRLRSTGPVAMSLTRSADRCDVVIENIDRLTGNEFVAVQDALYGSYAEFGRLWRDLRNPQNVYQVTLLTGQVVAARASETEVQLTLMSDIYSSGAIAGQIIYGRSCPWTFKDAATCGFVGAQTTCDKLLDSPDGCSGRANEHHFGGFPYIKGVDTISDAAGIQSNLQYQTIIQPAALTREELEAGARATTAIIQRHNLLLQGFTVSDDAANDATKIVAGGVGGANYQTLKENDGYTSVRVLPPQPTLNFLNAFKLTDDPGNLETDISTFGVPTGMLNVRTDFKASGTIAVTNVVAFNVAGIVTVQDALNLQPGMGILIEGAGVGGADFVGTVGSVSPDLKTYVLTAGFPTAPIAGARVQGDDTQAVQAWFTAHGDLAMPPGYYRLTSSIVVPSTSEGFSIIVHGSGWDLSVFAFQHGGDGFIPTAPDLKIDSLVFKDLTIGTGTKWDAGGLIDANSRGFGLRMTAPTLTGIYNDCILERCRVIGWGRFGLLSDNAEVCWINNCIFRENKHGHLALLAPDQIEAPKQPNANTLTSCTFDQAYGGGDAPRSATGAMTAARVVNEGDPPLTQAEIDAARTLTVSGLTLTAADRGRLVIVQGVGTNVSNLYSFIDVFLTSNSCRLGHDCRTSSGSAPVTVFSSSVASIFLNRAHDTVIDGATIQGNFTGALTTVDCNAIRADGCFNLRIVGVHEEDAGGVGGAAIRLENCQSVTIENWGGTSPGPPAFTNAHGADFQLINTHGVRVSQSYFNDRPQFNMDGNSSEIELDNSLVTGHNNLWQGDASWDRLKIGSGVRTYQAADARTNQTAGNEYMYDGLLAREVLLNSRFIDAPAPSTTGWATAAPTYWSLVYGSPERFDSYLRVNATAEAAGGGVKIFSQTVAVPDSIPAGSWTLGVDWLIESDAHITATGAYVEVRLKPSVGIEETLQWSSRSYTYVTGTWQVGQVKAWLGAGTARTIEVQINVTPGPSNPIIRLTNFRLTRGKHSFGAWARPVTDFGGKMRAPLEFEPIAVPPAAGGYPPPPTGSPILSIVNIGGVLNQGKNGAYVPFAPGGTGTISGPPNYYAVFNTAGTGLDYAALRQEITAPFAVHVLNSPLWIDRQRALVSDYTSSGAQATLAMVDSADVVYFGPEWSSASAKGGADVIIRAAHDDVSSLQIAGSARRMTFNVARALAGITAPLPTFLLGIADLNLDGLRIQPVASGLYLGYALATWDFGNNTDANFAVNQLGDIVRIKQRTYSWPAAHAAGFLQNNGSGNLLWAAPSTGGHSIQDEGTPLATQRSALNFKGAGVMASDEPAATRTNVEVFTAGMLQEGTVSVLNQDFNGHKWFHRGIHAWDDAGGLAVPLVCQVGSIAAATSGAHIQEWWISGSTPLAYLDTQPVLRLGYPGAGVGRAGYLELCCDATVQTVQLACGISATQSQIIYFPAARPTNNQVLRVASVFGGDVQLQWATPAASATAGHVIQEEGGPLTQRDALNFTGSGIRAVDSISGFLRTDVFVVAASQTVEGTVSIAAQDFDGLKTFHRGIVALNDTGGFAVPLISKVGLGGSSGAHIQEWQTSAVLAWIDTQPTLRLGIAGGQAGFLELASDGGAPTVKLAAGGAPTAAYTLLMPNAYGTVGQFLQAGTGGQLTWATVTPGGGTVTGSGTVGTLPKVLTASPYGVLQDSGITDNGTQIIASANLWAFRSYTNDFVDVYLQGSPAAGYNQGIWRYLHGPSGNLVGANQASGWGEMQLFFQAQTVPTFLVGHAQSWFQTALRVRPPSDYTADAYALEVQTSAGAARFRVDLTGNLSMINNLAGYSWPANHGQTGTGAYVLANDGAGLLTWRTFPTGTGSGANIQLSNLDNSGTALIPAVKINAHLGFGSSSADDGVYNLGAPAHRVGRGYFKAGFFVYTDGSTQSQPNAAGFLDPQVGEFTRMLLSGNSAIAQGGNGARLQFTSYHSFEFRGNRRNNGLGTPLAYFLPSGNDSSSFLIFLDNAAGAPDCIPLLVNTGSPITSDLFHVQNGGVTKFRIGAQGTLIGSQSGTILGVRETQIDYSLSSQSDRTVIVDTVSGNRNVYLPQVSSCRGQIFDIVALRQLQVVNNAPGAAGYANSVTINCQTSPNVDEFNGWAQSTYVLSNTPAKRAVRLVADSNYNIWWALPWSI